MALIVVFMTGCSSAPVARASVASFASHETAESAVTYAPALAEKHLTLHEAVNLALARHPALKAYRWELRQAEAQARQAALWPNPELAVELENVGGSGAMSGLDAAETTATLSQLISIGGDIRRRREVMDTLTAQVDWDYEAARIQLQLVTAHRYIGALAADRQLELAREELELAKETDRIAQQRVEAGEASPLERTEALTPLLDAELALKQAERSRAAAYTRLAHCWGESAAQFDSLSGSLESIRRAPSLEELAQHVESSPEVARWAGEIARRRAETRLAIAESIPDIRISGGIRHWNDTEETAFVLGASLPLPLYDRGQGSRRAARHAERVAHLRQEESRLQVETQLSSHFEQMANAYDEAQALAERGLPAMREVYEGLRNAYAEGDVSLLAVLNAQRTYFEMQRRYVRSLMNYHAALAEVEALIGKPISGQNN